MEATEFLESEDGVSEIPPYPARNVEEAIALVYAEVGYVKKTPSPELRYSYASEAELIAALRPAMVKNGLSVSVQDVKLLHNEVFETTRGTKMNRVLVSGLVAFTHTGGGMRHVSSLGEGSDAGDKATYKALTGMYKYALRQTFCIETGDDPDKVLSDDMERGGSLAVRVSNVIPAARPTVARTTRTPVEMTRTEPITAVRSRFASGRPIGAVETIDGQLMIECPDHGWSRAREFTASGSYPARIKCTKNSGSREAPEWCAFGVTPADGSEPPKPDTYYWIPAYNDLLSVNGDVISLKDIATVIGAPKVTFNLIDKWLKDNPSKDVYTLFEEAAQVGELFGSEPDDKPFE